ncbi:hypothetical protein D3C75_1132420 [compost metagenome]
MTGGDHLGQGGDGDLDRGLAADRQPDRRMDPVEPLPADLADALQSLQAALAGAHRAHGAQIEGL